MKIDTAFILYVSNQKESALFYAALLQLNPMLDVPGMTEFELSPDCKIGLMPEDGISKIIMPALPHPSKANGIPRCELYLKVADILPFYARAKLLKAKIVSEIAVRDWGDNVFYMADRDGHVIAFAQNTE